MVELQTEYEPDFVTAPGTTLQEAIEERDLTQLKLAERIGLSRQQVTRIINEEAPITPETALKLEHVLGIPARFWNTREQRFREFQARNAEQERLRHQEAWLKNFRHLSKMIEYGWLTPDTNDTAGKARALLSFFGIASPSLWDTYRHQTEALYRRSPSLDPDLHAIVGWLRQGELKARSIRCNPYDEDAFRVKLCEIRTLTVAPPQVFQSRIVEKCASCGVAVVFVRELPKTASGATRWLSPEKALIQLSLRFRTDDHFWFTFFHEAAHILKHPKRAIFLDGDREIVSSEEEADRWAANFLVPRNRLHEFLSVGRPTLARIEQFASDLAIAPGIVVGQLQHLGVIPFNTGNRLKRRFTWV